MRPRRAMIIAGGIMVLASAAVFVRQKSEPVTVSVCRETNANVTWYTVEVANRAHSQYVYSAWLEYETQGEWKPYTVGRASSTLYPSQRDVFPVVRPGYSKARIVLMYGRVRNGRLDQWIDSGKALVGMRPKPKRLYIDAP